MKIFKGILILVIGIISTISVAYFGFKKISEDSVYKRNKIKSEINEKGLDTIQSTVTEFGFNQLNRDRAESNVIYFKLADSEKYFCSSPSLKSYYLSQKWCKNLRIKDTVKIAFMKFKEDEKALNTVNIVEMFYKNDQVLFKDSFIEDKILKEKNWLEKTTFVYPNLIMLLIFIPIIFIFWSFSIMRIIRKSR